MATTSPSPELASMASFRDALPISETPSDTIDRLCAIGQFRRVARGDEMAADRHDDALVFISDGVAKLVAQERSAKLPVSTAAPARAGSVCPDQHILAFHFPGDIISVLHQSGSRICLIALSDLELIVFSAEHFLDVAQNDPLVIRAVLTRSLNALHRSRTKVMQLGHKSARQRIADFLISMAKRVCGCTNGECEFALPMSRRDIGNSLGLTIETVSRQFGDLRDAGLVVTRGRSTVRIVNIRALSQEAGTPLSNQKISET